MPAALPNKPRNTLRLVSFAAAIAPPGCIFRHRIASSQAAATQLYQDGLDLFEFEISLRAILCKIAQRECNPVSFAQLAKHAHSSHNKTRGDFDARVETQFHAATLGSSRDDDASRHVFPPGPGAKRRR
jgi:hypothetical protein